MINSLAIKAISLAAFLTGVMGEARCQTASDTLNLDEPTFGKIQEQPEYPGGYAKMMSFLSNDDLSEGRSATKDRGDGAVAFVVDQEGHVETQEPLGVFLRSAMPRESASYASCQSGNQESLMDNRPDYW